jgi:hypothetical protein
MVVTRSVPLTRATIQSWAPLLLDRRTPCVTHQPDTLPVKHRGRSTNSSPLYSCLDSCALMSELFLMPYDHHIVSRLKDVSLAWPVNRLIKAPSCPHPTTLHCPLNQLEQQRFSQEPLLWHFQLQTAQTVSCALVFLLSFL